MNDVFAASVELHERHHGKLTTVATVPLSSGRNLAVAYTPGIAGPARRIAGNPELSYDLTWRGQTVAIISDGSAVLGLGNIGPEAALPVMEGKAVLLKKFAGLNGMPIVVGSQDSRDIIQFVRMIRPSVAAVNLEDIAAPRCFEISESLQDIGIPVFHDDQDGTAIVVAAALRNASRVVGKPYESLRVTILGAGAAGLATARMLLGLTCSSDVCTRLPHLSRVRDVIVVDRMGCLYPGRERQNVYKQAIAGVSNSRMISGGLDAAIDGSDVFIGVSGPGLLQPNHVSRMASRPIVFALANPEPEILPEEARRAGAMVVATGRSDFPNQINNVLCYPGIFLAVTRGKLKHITSEMKQQAVLAIESSVPDPTASKIIPSPFTPHLADTIAKKILNHHR